VAACGAFPVRAALSWFCVRIPVPALRVSAVFDSDAVGKIEGIIDVEDGQG
jgi:hypothetical protein